MESKFIEEFLMNFLSGAVGSFFAAIGFMFFIFNVFRPRLKMAKTISKFHYEDPSTGQTGIIYKLKFINDSIWFDCVDINVALEKKRTKPVSGGSDSGGGRHEYLESLELYRSNFVELPRKYKKLKRRYRNDAPYAIQVRTKENLEEILKEEPISIVIKVTAKNKISGIPGSFKQEFSENIEIVDSEFEFGAGLGHKKPIMDKK